MNEVWRSGKVKILGLSGLNGQGKTSLVRRFLEDLKLSENPPHSVFWWTFDPTANEVDDFLVALIEHVSDGAVDPSILPLGTAKANLAAVLLQSGQRHVVILDGLDGFQIEGGELKGTFTSQALKDFLSYVAAGDSRSFCILTGPQSYSDFEPLSTFIPLSVERLSKDDGRLLLLSNGVRGDHHVLDEIVEDWEGHPLALTAVSLYIESHWGGHARRLTELPGVGDEFPFMARLQTVGAALERERSASERLALTVLSLARLPIPESVLTRIVDDAIPNDGNGRIDLRTSYLAQSGIVRLTTEGDLLLHPVLRSLYRARIHYEDFEFVKAQHRALADYYYRTALEPNLGDANFS